jgi:hypothetical protein
MASPITIATGFLLGINPNSSIRKEKNNNEGVKKCVSEGFYDLFAKESIDLKRANIDKQMSTNLQLKTPRPLNMGMVHPRTFFMHCWT